MQEKQIEVKNFGGNWSAFPHELSRDPSISIQAKGLFAIYGSFINANDPTSFASEKYLCKICGGINCKTFRRYKRELVQSGWISQTQSFVGGKYSTLLVTRYQSPSHNKRHVAGQIERINYEKYIVSDEWREKRTKYLKKVQCRCEVCNSSNTEIHIHHKTYERLGNELDSDLIALCKDCHQLFHKNRKLASKKESEKSDG